MNKITITLISFLAIMFFTGSAYAGTFTQTGGAGTAVTVPDGAGTSAALTFTPSPGIVIAGVANATAFTVISANVKAEGNAVGYCMVNGSPTVYQEALTSLTGTSTSSNLGTVPTAGTSAAGYAPRQ